MKKLTTLFVIIFFVGVNSVLAQMQVKDTDSNVLLEFNDEGAVGSITIPSAATAPLTVLYKLYNVNGTLFFNGNALSGGWSLTGNSGTTAGTNFLGTTDNQALEFHVNSTRAFRIEPDPVSPNIIGGFIGNFVATSGATISGGGSLGFPNSVTGDFGTISGGKGNTVSGARATVSGGGQNTASDTASTVSGGQGNTASGLRATVAGGGKNEARGDRSTIGGGGQNITRNLLATIGGGLSNAVGTASGGDYGTVGGGIENTARGNRATIGGGGSNIASGLRSTVAGGGQNWAGGTNATVVGGKNNTAGGQSSIVGGGEGNKARGLGDTVVGGVENIISADYSTIGGGQKNNVTSGITHATISGGNTNIASGVNSTIGGGETNTASGASSTVAGGFGNSASGIGATVPGGKNNLAAGNYSFAAGLRAKANHAGTFVWADNTMADFSSTKAKTFIIRAANGVGIGTPTPDAKLHVVGKIKMVDGNQGAGKVLTSDANGVGTWQAAAGGGASGWTDDGTVVRLTTTTDMVGIGTTTPSAPLSLGSSGGNTKLAVYDNGAGDRAGFGIQLNQFRLHLNEPADRFSFLDDENGNERMTILGTGNVGIGTSTPIAKLEVKAGHNDGIKVTGEATANHTVLALENNNTNGTEWDLLSIGGGSNLGQGKFIILDKNATPAAQRPRFTIDADGDVGIGTTSPNEQLEITGNFRLPATTNTTTPTGVIFSGANRFIHNYGLENFFAGKNAGNLTMMGGANVGVGENTLLANTSGNANVAINLNALSDNTEGIQNIAIGVGALDQNTSGSSNTAVGHRALEKITTGFQNIAIGKEAGVSLTANDNNNIDIGHNGVVGDVGTIRIGSAGTHFKTFMAGIRGVTTGMADAVSIMIDSAGQLGTVSSSRRFKQDIQDIGEASNDLMKLRPVQFSYKSDKTSTLQYGLIAEEVAEIYPELVVHSPDGQIETVRYHLLSSMLLNELQKQYKINDQQKNEIEQLKAKMSRFEMILENFAALKNENNDETGGEE